MRIATVQLRKISPHIFRPKEAVVKNDTHVMVTSKRISFERIFCPIDLTPDSKVSLRYAVTLARSYGAELVVCHCHEMPGMEASVTECNRRQIEELTNDAIRFGTNPLPRWEPLIIEGDKKTVIPREAAEYGADLLVMCSRRRPNSAALLGSTAEAICRTAPCPVLVTHRPEHEWVGLSTNQIDLRKILVAYDFSSDAELALAYGLSLAQEYQTEIHLLHVLPRQKAEAPEICELPSPAERVLSQTLQHLQKSIPKDAKNWCSLRPLVLFGSPYREILTYTEDHSIDLICMGVHGTGFGMKALFGSNVDRVLRQAPCPVLIARPLKPAKNKFKIA